MQSEATTQSDSALLESWCERHSESAFEELVRRYERLVTGAALRRAGDLEVARDIAQQVFAMLAAKARLLIGRTNITGWLYCAADHVAAQLRRSDARRLARHTTAAADYSADATNDQWGILDDSLAELSASDREALLLHYFQDLSYPEMTVELQVSEAAARKRVSRAVRSLARGLRKRGLNSPKALIAGAAALQMSFPTHTTLAASALATTSSVSTPVPLVLHALMSHSPVKIAICAASVALLPLGYEWTSNADLRTELAEKRRQPAQSTQPAPPKLVIEEAAALTEMRAELARVETATKAAKARVAELSRFRDRAKEELVVSMGTVEAMAKGIATLVRQLTEWRDKSRSVKPDTPPSKELDALTREASANLPEIFNIARELPRLERDPAKAARFYATLVAEVAGLDETTRGRLEPPLTAWVAQLQRDALSFPQRPTEPAEATADWDKRRIAAMQEISKVLQALAPPDKAAQTSMFDALLIEPDETSAREAFDIISGKKQ